MIETNNNTLVLNCFMYPLYFRSPIRNVNEVPEVLAKDETSAKTFYTSKYCFLHLIEKSNLEYKITFQFWFFQNALGAQEAIIGGAGSNRLEQEPNGTTTIHAVHIFPFQRLGH